MKFRVPGTVKTQSSVRSAVPDTEKSSGNFPIVMDPLPRPVPHLYQIPFFKKYKSLLLSTFTPSLPQTQS